MKMTTDIDKVQIGLLLVCLFNPGWGILTITSTPFECGRSASIVCSRLDETVGLIAWYMNGFEIRCIIDRCRNPTLGNYNFIAGGGVWTIAIDPVELKDNNITFTCGEPYSDAPFRVLLTTDVSVPMDISSTLTKIENTTDVILKAQTNCVKPVESVDITWQCVKADQVKEIDSDCRLTSLPTYTSECRDLNQTCAGPGTFRMGSDVKLSAYRGNYFKLVKIKAVFIDGTTVIEKISGQVKQEVSPRIAPLRDCSVIENTDFSVSCNLSSGDPSTLKCKWTAPSGTMTNNCTLRIPSVQRTSSGTYTCRVENSVGIDTKSFYLYILYKTVISALTIDDREDSLVVNQNKTDVQFKCNVSSNPLSQISLRSTTISGSRILKEELSSDHLLYSLPTATCWDSGIYTCSGRNNVTENKVSKAVILLVECIARPLHETEKNITIYRGVGDDVTLNLTLVAYPLPASELFQWSRLDKEHSTSHLNGSIVNISETSLESSLTLKHIREEDFGQYKLTIKFNDTMDAYVQDFLINAQDRPQVPGNFIHLDEQLTTTTAVLKWTPGFDGGVPQVFNILYKKASDSSWSHIIVSSPPVTLTGLDPSTLYNVYMFASNELGNSSYTTTLNIITVQAIEESQSPNNAAIIGGAAGAAAVILLVVAVVLLVVFIRRLEANKSRQSADSQRRNVDEHDIDDPTTGTHGHSGTNEYYNTSRNTYEELQTCSSSGPYEDLNPRSTTEHAYGTLNRNNDDNTPAMPTSSTYENLRLTPFK